MFEFDNVIDNLICWLVMVYNVCMSHIVRRCLVWGLLVMYTELLSLFQHWYKFYNV